MKLILITTPDFYPHETDDIRALFRAGLETLHLRKPGATARGLRAWLQEIDAEFRGRIVTHEHFELADDFHLKGVHLNGRNPQAPAGWQGHLSCSCHSLEEVAARKPHCNYVFLSPICDSISKAGYEAAFTPEQLQQAAHRGVIDRQVVALGGISLARLPMVREAGFGGAAVLGDLWSHRGKDLIPYFLQLKSAAL